jgi:hypothetical protein
MIAAIKSLINGTVFFKPFRNVPEDVSIEAQNFSEGTVFAILVSCAPGLVMNPDLHWQAPMNCEMDSTFRSRC